jgi:hypothetical protein
MAEQATSEFRESEVAVLRHWDKKKNEWFTNIFPKLGGRLRLGHEKNEKLSIESEIYKYDGNIAVVIAKTRTDKGVFFGIGMSSLERDEQIAPAILEMAESRAIARSLRFAGYGVEYCSAEEISHLENGNGDRPNVTGQTKQSGGNGKNLSQKPDNGNGNNHGPETRHARVEVGFEPVEGCPTVGKPHFRLVEDDIKPPEPENGNAQLQMSSAQWRYLRDLGRQKGWNLTRLSEKAIEMFGVEMAYLSKKDASTFLNHLITGN